MKYEINVSELRRAQGYSDKGSNHFIAEDGIERGISLILSKMLTSVQKRTGFSEIGLMHRAPESDTLQMRGA